MPGMPRGPLDELRALLDAAVADPAGADATRIQAAAAEQFAAFKRTDMRSGVATIIRRLAQLHANGDQTIERDGWALLRQAADLLARPGLAPADIRQLDERLQDLGLDVDYRPPMPVHEPSRQNPN
jgi:hypothetical protein